VFLLGIIVKNEKKILGLALVVSVTLTSGCASILNSRAQIVNITTSNGAKVSVSVDGKTIEAPGIVALDRSKMEKIITTTDPRCSPQTIAHSKTDPMFFLNVLGLGDMFFSSTTDYATEKMWKYDDTTIIACT
jgi:uncharacterized protein YceK